MYSQMPLLEIDLDDLPVAEEDRRRSERHPHVCQAWLAERSNPAHRWEAAAVSLSRHGVGLDVPVYLPAGRHLTIEIGVGPQHVAAEVRIINCRPNDDGTFHIGAEFC